MNSQILTVCFTKGMTLMAKIRDYKGGDYGKGYQNGRYAVPCIFSKTQNPKTNKSKEQEN